MLQLRKSSLRNNPSSNNYALDNANMIPMTLMDNNHSNNQTGIITQQINHNNNIGQMGSSQNLNISQFGAVSNTNVFNINAPVFEENINNSRNLEWINKEWIQRIVRACALFSFISICANTPETFKKYKYVMVLTYICDLVSTLVFTVEMVAKIKIKKLFHGDNAYIFDRWCQFDGIMVVFHIISVVLQTFELNGRGKKYWPLLRCPRPLILIRVIRSFLKFRLPKNRINSILQRSSSQCYNVTIFFLFFMALYGILGVQFFGELTSHCVKNGTDPLNVKINDLMIPDTYCSPLGPEFGYQCPPGMECIKINLKLQDRGFNGFDEIVTSIFTVYEAASQEGWVFLMYRATDSLPSWRAFFYFISMIFFLAWLVKNVFIAVIIETFAEIRVQFQQMWSAKELEAQLGHSQVFERTENGLKLVTIDENKADGKFAVLLQKITRSPYFNMSMLLLVLANAVITATIKHSHKEIKDRKNLEFYRNIEIIFTLLFNLEALFKIYALGFKSYIKRSIYKFEFILAIFTTIRLLPQLYQTELTYFQVLRIIRLIKSSPLLEDFVYKIFGPGKKLGSLIIFTMILLIITSCVSMQLFCFLGSAEYTKFDTFDLALMSQFSIVMGDSWPETMYETMRAIGESHEFHFPYYIYFMPIYFIFSHMFCSLAFMQIFQIMTQKGWLDVMHSTMIQSQDFSPLVAIYFIFYHLFVTLILLSLFVAVILDNLELEEEVKKIKQLKAREQSAETQQQLPWRLRIFEKFPNHPQMIHLKKVSNDFAVPKIRESFMRQFIGDNDFNLALETSTITDPTIINDFDSQHNRTYSNRISKPTNLSSITETPSPSFSDNPTSPTINTNIISLADLNSSSMFNKRKMTTPNSRTVQLRVLNNIRTQRACRYSIKKTAITNIVKTYNTQRLFNEESLANPSLVEAGNPLTRNRQSKERRDKKVGKSNVKLTVTAATYNKPNPMLISADPGTGGVDFKIFQYKKQQAELKRNQLEEDLKENHPYFDKPLFTIGRESSLRKFCQMIVEARYIRIKVQKNLQNSSIVKDRYKQFHKILGLVSYLDWLMILVTIQSCIGMMFETPTMRLVDTWQLKIVEYLFIFFMSIEMMLKICAYGLFFTPNAVVKDFAGILDLFIFFVSVLFLYLSPQEVVANSGSQFLMILRCLRPLRIFTLVPHMRKVIYELCRGSKEILLVSVLLVVLIFIFASYGIQIFGGKLARCNDEKITERKQCIGLYKRNLFVSKLKLEAKNSTTPSIWVPRVWANPYNFNFDSIGSSMIALFEVLSLEGWLEVRDIIIEQMGTRHAIFVHVFVFIGTLIGLTLFVGVVITNYSENKGTALLTVDQRRWLDLKGRIKLVQPLHIPPRPKDSRFRAFMFDTTQHRTFKRFSAFLVIMNCGLLSVPWKQNDTATLMLTSLASVFTLLFLIEVFMKSCALGFFGYWQSRRNRLDMFVTFLGLVWIIMHFISMKKKELEEAGNTFGFIVIVLRFFTIAGKHATLKMLMLTIANSFFKSFFIIVGMVLMMLVYAFAGVILFGSVKSGHDLGRHANFGTSPNAMLLLMRIVTGEDWNKIMHDCMVAPPACSLGNNYWESDCGNHTAALLYFCSFYVIITYIVLNLLVAIIMENFSLFYSNEEDALLSYNDIRHFQIVWNIVDINRKGIIPCKRVKFLLRLLRGRLEVDLEKDRLLFKHMCYEIERLNNGGDVTFHDVLNMLSYRSVDIGKSLKLEELLSREELEYQIEEEVAKKTIRDWLDGCLRRMRERGNITMTKTMNRQNDIAIFKEQLGARNMLIKNQNSMNANSNVSNPNSVNQEFKITHHNEITNDSLGNGRKAVKKTSIQETSVTVVNGNSELSCKLSNPKIKKRNTADRQMQMRNEENLEKRNQLIIESQSMTRDVKNWWNSTLNDNDY